MPHSLDICVAGKYDPTDRRANGNRHKPAWGQQTGAKPGSPDTGRCGYQCRPGGKRGRANSGDGAMAMIFGRMIQPAAWCVLAVTAGLLQGCSTEKPPAPPAPQARTFAIDQTGAAKSCTAPHPSLTAGKPSDVAMAVGNDGGWCGLLVAQAGPKPFGAGLLTARPAHGTVYIHSVGDDTRIDYTPEFDFAGTDGFTVQLLPGDASIRVSVTVAPK
jgi:hypothetical protein